MAGGTARLVAEVLRAAGEQGAGSDPEYFRRKAEAFDRIAVEQPDLAGECREFAANARRRAQQLESN